MSFDLWAHAFCACFFKGERCYCSVIDYQVVHMFLVVLCEVAIVLQDKSINFFRDAATDPILSLTTTICAYHIPWIMEFVSNDLDAGNYF